MRDIDGDRVLLQNGTGGRSGIWTLDSANTVTNWQPISEPLADWDVLYIDFEGP